jgi:RNA polymerase sigma factor (sigma-70 family)
MWPSDDSELLRRYAEQGSDEAFAALVGRYLNLVYSVALRRVANPHHAEEITQAVFIVLAKKAGGLRHARALSSWLFETTRLTAANFIRSEQRRRVREQEAQMQTLANEPSAEVWSRIAPLLDDAVAALRDKERRAILLRFYEDKDLREVGAALGISEEAAKKRVARALEKLRTRLGRRTAVVSMGLLTSLLATRCVEAAPPLLAKMATAAALSEGAAASASTLILVKGALKVMAWTKTQMTVATALIVGLATVSVMQHQAQARLREADDLLRQQLAQAQADNEQLARRQHQRAPRLPAPQIQPPVAPAAAAPPPSAEATNLYARLYQQLQDKPLKLTPDQIQAYLKSAGTNATSLLAAFRTSGDVSLLHEAMEKYPGDAQVAFEAAFDSSLPADQKRQWLDAFEKAAPDNALANYLSAQNYFQAGQTDQGLREVQAAASKSFDDFTASRAMDDIEALLASGYSMADAKVLATSQLLLPQLVQMKQLGLSLVQSADAYTQAGDAASAQAVLQMAADVGQRYSTPTPGEAEISQLVGIWIEHNALASMSPGDPYGDPGQTVQDRLNQLTQQNDATRQLGQQASNLMPGLSDQDWIIYKDRWLMFGEANAQQWVIDKYGGK